VEYVVSVLVFFSWYGLSLGLEGQKNTAESVRFPAVHQVMKYRLE
jgi:hypothetical protein